jgi:hypothetical protein
MKKQEFDKMMKESFGDRVVNIPKPRKQALVNWYDFFVDYVQENHRNIYNNACEFADRKEEE